MHAFWSMDETMDFRDKNLSEVDEQYLPFFVLESINNKMEFFLPMFT